MMDHIEAALKRSPGDYSTDDVASLVASGEARYWPMPNSAAVTEETRAFHIWLAGGNRRELFEMLESAEHEHRARGFDFVTIQEARPGWARLLKPRGYEPRTLLVKEL